MKASDRVILNTGILYARMGVTVLLSLYTTRITLEALGVADFGIFNVVGGTIAMLTFLNSSMAAATQRYMSFAFGRGSEERLASIFNASLKLHVGIALLVLVFLEVVGYALFSYVLKISQERTAASWMIYQFAVASTFFSIALTPYDAVINARENMLLFAALGVIESILKVVVAVYISQTAGDRLIEYGLLMAMLVVFLLLVKMAYCHLRYPECVIFPRKGVEKSLFKEMTSFAGWSLLGASTSIAANYGQGIVLNTFFGAVTNAAQGISGQVSGQLGALATTMLRALNPLIAKSEGAGNRGLMLQASMVGTRIGFFLLMLLYVPVIVEMPYIFKMWLKDVPDFTVEFCRLLLIRNLVEQFYITIYSSISAVGDIRRYQLFISIANVVPLFLSFALFYGGSGPVAMYVVYFLYSVVAMVITLWFAKDKCGLNIQDYLWKVVFRCLCIFLASISITVFVGAWADDDLVRLLVEIVASFVAFVFLVWFAGISSSERREFGAAVVRLKKLALKW